MDFIKLPGAPYLEPLHKTFFEFALVKAAGDCNLPKAFSELYSGGLKFRDLQQNKILVFYPKT